VRHLLRWSWCGHGSRFRRGVFLVSRIDTETRFAPRSSTPAQRVEYVVECDALGVAYRAGIDGPLLSSLGAFVYYGKVAFCASSLFARYANMLLC
jgi:hypothetical protein